MQDIISGGCLCAAVCIEVTPPFITCVDSRAPWDQICDDLPPYQGARPGPAQTESPPQEHDQ